MPLFTILLIGREKVKSNHRFPSIITDKSRESLKSEKEKVVSSNFQEKFNWKKGRMDKSKN